MSRVLITGAAGMIGRSLLQESMPGHEWIATDITNKGVPEHIQFMQMDVTSDDPEKVIAKVKPDVIIHLASIVTPPPGMTRDATYAVDVEGTQKVLQAAIEHKVKRLVVTSSGAAYGYHKDNVQPLTEDQPCRGNEEFAYSYHKRLVEEMLEQARLEAPNLEQVVLRLGTVLAPGTDNQITALFHKPRLLALIGNESPFVFIGANDLSQILLRAATDGPKGIYNVAGDGVMGVSAIAKALNKPVLRLPAWLLRGVLGLAKPLGLSRYGPEQVGFLEFRPVLANDALKQDFGYQPKAASAQVFDEWRRSVGL